MGANRVIGWTTRCALRMVCAVAVCGLGVVGGDTRRLGGSGCGVGQCPSGRVRGIDRRRATRMSEFAKSCCQVCEFGVRLY